MKKTVLCVILALPVIGFAGAHLKHFKAVKEAFLHGDKVRVVINFNDCSPAMPMHAAYTPNTVMLLSGKIAFANSHLTFANPSRPGAATLEQVSYQILEKDSKMVVKTTFADPKDYRVIGQPITTTCQLNGKAVKFYKD